jgi:hypothetical protein
MDIYNQYRSRYARVGNQRIIQAWIDGATNIPGRRGMYGDQRLWVENDVLISYKTPIAMINRSTNRIRLNKRKYSLTTTVQQGDVQRVALQNGYKVVEVGPGELNFDENEQMQELRQQFRSIAPEEVQMLEPIEPEEP